MIVADLCEQFGVKDVQAKVATHAMALASEDTGNALASLLFDLDFCLRVLTLHTGDTTDPEVSHLMGTVVAALTGIDQIIGMADHYGLSNAAVDELIEFSANTSVLLAAFSIDGEG